MKTKSIINKITPIKSKLQKHQNIKMLKQNPQIDLIELIKILEKHRHNIIINLQHLQSNYQRRGIKRIPGCRDDNGNLLEPSLTTEHIDQTEYVPMGTFAFNRNTATINMLITRRVRLVEAENKTPIIEVAGLLLNDLHKFNNYTIVSDGKVNVKSLQVKIHSKKVFDLLQKKGVLTAEKFDFHQEYTIRLDNLALVPADVNYRSIDGLFSQLGEFKVLSSIISAHLKTESDTFLAEQLEELQQHYISKNLYINFPTTKEYKDIQSALVNGIIDSRVSYKIDIGSKEILNLDKFHSANKFLDRMYEVYDIETGEIFSKPTFDMAFNPNIAFRHKQLSSRIKFTPVDSFMKPIFDDFLGLDNNGIVSQVLTKLGTNSLVRILQDKRNGKKVRKEKMVTALTAANRKLENYVEKIYRHKISPLVFYIGSTGMLPNDMEAKAMNAKELTIKYPDLQLSKDEQGGIFFEVGETIVSVYEKKEYYTKEVTVG
ncbi:MAG: hypothetical protein QNJ47_27285 [Nostocaceae cyanobacterium]|nr:hypothetical protein [Nostocaceae cyanobacterium]